MLPAEYLLGITTGPRSEAYYEWYSIRQALKSYPEGHARRGAPRTHGRGRQTVRTTCNANDGLAVAFLSRSILGLRFF